MKKIALLTLFFFCLSFVFSFSSVHRFDTSGSVSPKEQFWQLGFVHTPSTLMTVTVTSTSDNGPGSLREAINTANADPLIDLIEFNISGTPPHQISLASSLPTITDEGVRINGTSNSNALGDIVLDGSAMSTGYLIITQGANDLIIEGLRFQNGPASIGSGAIDVKIAQNCIVRNNWVTDGYFGITVGNSSSNVSVTNNVIGTDLSGTADLGLIRGGVAVIFGCSNNTVTNNVIANVGDFGIMCNQNSNNNLFFQNELRCNGKGIDLNLGNSPGNQSIARPTIQYANTNYVGGTAPANSRVDVYLSDRSTCLISGCQGASFLGSATADNNGYWELVSSFPEGEEVTALAVDVNNNTSEFSFCIVVRPPLLTDACPLSPNNLELFPDDGYTIGTFNNRNAAPDSDQQTCATTATERGVWFAFTGDGTAYEFSIALPPNSSFGTPEMSVYSGECNTLTEVTCTSTLREISLTTVVDETYYLLIDDVGPEGGFFELTVMPLAAAACQITGNTVTVTSLADSGSGTLREAIGCVNDDPLVRIIQFDIPGAGPHVIAPTSPLPAISIDNPEIIAPSDESITLDGLAIGANYILNFMNATEIIVRNLTFTNTQNVAGAGGMLFSGVNTAGVINCDFTSCYTGIESNNSSFIDIISSRFGVDPPGLMAIPNYRYGFTITNGSSDIRVSNCLLGYHPVAAINIEANATSCEVWSNEFFCNNKAIDLNLSSGSPGNGGIVTPSIATATSSTITGMATPNATVQLYFRDNSDCGANSSCEGRSNIFSVTAAGDGSFSFSGPFPDTTVTVLQVLNGNTSEFAACAATVCHPDYDALMALYNSTGGDNWTNKGTNMDPTSTTEGWGMDCLPCDWYGVTCTDGRVTSIDLDGNNSGSIFSNGGNNLNGFLPNEIGQLDALEGLFLSNNTISGTIPNTINGLVAIRTIALEQSSLTGGIPIEFYDLTTIENIYISAPSFGGILNERISQLINLQNLYINLSQLNGQIPQSIGDLTNLRHLLLFGNNLTGSLPPSIGNLQQLEILRLDLNDLSGNIPSELGNLSSAIRIWLHQNDFEGEIPTELFALPSIERLYLSQNNLSGCFPIDNDMICGLGTSEAPIFDGYNFNGNPLLPYQGDYERICNGEPQIGAPCDDGNALTTGETIQADCSCALSNPCDNDTEAPTCIPPDPVMVSCADIPAALRTDLEVAFANDPATISFLLDEEFGFVNGFDNCSDVEFTTVSVVDMRANCGVGEITRTFSATDQLGFQSNCAQTITIFDDEPPLIDFLGSSQTVCASVFSCTGFLSVDYNLLDACAADGTINQTVRLDRFANDASGNGFISVAEFDNTNAIDITASTTSNGDGAFTLNPTELPIGLHAIMVIADDGCGNQTSDTYTLIVEDCDVSIPDCEPDWQVNLITDFDNPVPVAFIDATDLVSEPNADCSGPIDYAIYLASEAQAPGFIPSPADNFLTLGCADVDNNIEVRLYAIDPAGNFAFCTSFVRVVDLDNLCSIPCEETDFTLSVAPITDICGSVPVTLSLEITGNGNPPYTVAVNDGTMDIGLVIFDEPGVETFTFTPTQNTQLTFFTEDAADCQGAIQNAEVNILQPLTAPELSCLEVTASTITLGWELVPGADSYLLDIDNAG
ncbi:MAG: right-handed parallel beta-helix repeat-containing protein, partial [Bacteroidota bacterium]